MFLEEQLGDSDISEKLDKILSAIPKSKLGSGPLDSATLQCVLTEITASLEDRPTEAIYVIDAFKTPKLRYDHSTKGFLASTETFSIFGTPEQKIRVFQDRYTLLRQRLLRSKPFAPPPVITSISSASAARLQLTPIESLAGSHGVRCVLGMISQIKEGMYFLEDPGGYIPIDLSGVKTTAGLFMENSIVLAEGEVIDSVFRVKVMGFPPHELKAETRAAFGNVDFFGAGLITMQDYPRMLEQEELASTAMFVVVSDLWLDKPEVLSKLERLLAGFATSPPTLFLFIGSFLSRAHGLSRDDSAKSVKSYFDALADVISKYPSLIESSKFIFVPGSNDPGAQEALPRPAIPLYFVQRIREVLPEAIFTSNPCRIRYYTQEIVVFREDLLHKMRKHCILPPSDETENLSEHLVMTLLNQSHMFPLPFAFRPIIWAYDHVLHLYPMPDVLIVADKCGQYDWTYEDCVCFNPSSFPSEFAFTVYYPSRRETEHSKM